MKTILAILLVAAAGINVHSYPNHDPFSFNSGHDYQRTALGDSIDKASLKLLKEAYKSSEDKNVIASPLGVLILLSLFSNGAGNASRQEISTILGGTDYKQISEDYIRLSHEFGNMNPDFLTLANKIYVQAGYALDATFSETARDYRSGLESIDFKNPQKAADTINKWSDEKTKGHIKKPVSADVISSDTVAGLFNVIFFQGHWHVPFDAKNTKDEDFHVDKHTTVKKPTMHLLQSLYYTESEELGARLVELPYKEDGFRMVIVLPNENDGLPSVLEKVSQKGLMGDIFKLQPSGRDVDLHIPKFEIKSKLDLNDLLPKVGVTKIFQEAAPGIVKNEAVVVSKAFQEAFVKIDEEGATAGAFTGVLAVFTSSLSQPPPQPLEFKVDHPFLFTILHNDRVLFAGTYTK